MIYPFCSLLIVKFHSMIFIFVVITRPSAGPIAKITTERCALFSGKIF